MVSALRPFLKDVFYRSCRKMRHRYFEQRIKIKLLAKSCKTAIESNVTLKNTESDEKMSRAHAYEWYKRFLDGREDGHDDPKSSRPKTTEIDENIERGPNLVRSDRRSTIRMMAKMLTMNRE